MSEAGWIYLPGTPWSMRLAGGPGGGGPGSGRPALEVYAAGALIDVTVASARASQFLRGACTVTVARQARTIAWGCLPPAWSDLPSVEFLRGRIRRRVRQEEAERIAGGFWFAEIDGRFDRVRLRLRSRPAVKFAIYVVRAT